MDDNEIDNLLKICNEIFGESNFIAQCVRKRRDSQANLSKNISPIHEYILIYCKQFGDLLNKVKANIDESSFKNPDNDPRGPYTTMPCTNKGGSVYTVTTPTGVKITEEWRFKKETYNRLSAENRLVFSRGGEGKPRYKLFLNEKIAEGQLANTWFDNLASNQEATREIKELFNGSVVFDTPKPVDLLSYLEELATNQDCIILDFFSGSAATAHATMQLNAEDGGNRKFIMVQLEEKTDEKSEAYKAGYNTICEIGEERIRRAGDKIKAEHPDANIDIGFKVFEIADTNIKWNELELKNEQIDFANLSNNPDQVDFKQGTKDIDVVYEIMLRQKNIPLSSKIEVLDEIGSRTYLYADSYLICLETQVTNDMIDKLASLDPTPFKYIFRDSAFKDDIDLKTNAFRRLKAMVEKHAGATKKAYTVEFI